MSGPAARCELTEQELEPILKTLQDGHGPLTTKQIRAVKAQVAASYQIYVSLKCLPKSVPLTTLKRDVALTVKRLRQAAEELRSLHPDSFPGLRAMERTARTLKIGDQSWSVRDQAMRFLSILATSFEAEMAQVESLRSYERGYFLTSSPEQLLIQSLILLWCDVLRIKLQDVAPGNPDEPGPLVRFLQPATEPVRNRLRLGPIPRNTLRDLAGKVKRGRTDRRVRKQAQKM